jgi:hypothetical protein
MARLLRVVVFACCFFLNAPLVAKADLVLTVGQTRIAIESRIEPNALAILHEIGGPSRTAAELESLAHALTLNRQFTQGAWLYAAAIESDRNSAASYSSLGVLLAEGVTLAAGTKPDEAVLATIVELQREARRLDGKSAAIANNLGAALTAFGANRSDRTIIEEGAFLIHEAVQANPQNVIYYVRLAEALSLMGETSAAKKFLEAAFHLNSAHPALVMARGPGGALADLPMEVTRRDLCAVNYACDAKCPKSIIGQIDLVTCRIAESSAQSSCRDGKPYAQFFDCSAKLPRFGILIPGLDPGLSIVTPWGSIDFVVQGDGKVDFQLKFNSPSLGPAQASLQTQGSWEPSRGDVALNFEAGVQVNLFNRVSPVMEQANAYDVGLSIVEKYDVDGGTLKTDIEVGRGGVLTD